MSWPASRGHVRIQPRCHANGEPEDWRGQAQHNSTAKPKTPHRILSWCVGVQADEVELATPDGKNRQRHRQRGEHREDLGERAPVGRAGEPDERLGPVVRIGKHDEQADQRRSTRGDDSLTGIRPRIEAGDSTSDRADGTGKQSSGHDANLLDLLGAQSSELHDQFSHVGPGSHRTYRSSSLLPPEAGRPRGQQVEGSAARPSRPVVRALPVWVSLRERGGLYSAARARARAAEAALSRASPRSMLPEALTPSSGLPGKQVAGLLCAVPGPLVDRPAR